jgi:hypothetical protein
MKGPHRRDHDPASSDVVMEWAARGTDPDASKNEKAGLLFQCCKPALQKES